jgi:hypothetical protein
MSHPLAIRPETVNIAAPLIRGSRLPPVLRVTTDSPRTHRRAVYRLADSFLREMQFGFLQYGYDGDEDDPDHVAFLWVHPETAGLTWEFRVPCVGACCFRLRDEGRALQWIWIHPFFRRKGLVSGMWPRFVREFADFAVEGPLSDAMKGFLAKCGHGGPVP